MLNSTHKPAMEIFYFKVGCFIICNFTIQTYTPKSETKIITKF